MSKKPKYKNIKFNRPTVGEITNELSQKEHLPLSPIELGREMLKQYSRELEEAIKKGKKKFYKQDFYIVSYIGKPKIFSETLSARYVLQSSCPSPTNDQSVFKYINSRDELEYIWTVPDTQTCRIFMDNASQVQPSEWDLLKFVYEFHDGTLLNIAKKLNGELS